MVTPKRANPPTAGRSRREIRTWPRTAACRAKSRPPMAARQKLISSGSIPARRAKRAAEPIVAQSRAAATMNAYPKISLVTGARTLGTQRRQLAHPLGVATGRLPEQPPILAAELRRARVSHLVRDCFRARRSDQQQPTRFL